MLDSKTIKKINDFIYLKPRTVQEVAGIISKNWRTAESYLQKISKEHGTISLRTFRKGTRGALKIAYWNNIEKIHSHEFQEKLLKKIESSKKTDFSPFDIYQYVDEKRRNAVMINAEKLGLKDQVKPTLKKAQEQVLSFSGNLSWINSKEGNERLADIVENLAKNNVSIKILSRVTIDSIKNIQKVLLINEKIGRTAIEIRHREQPLRGFIIDSKIARFRESEDPSDYEKGELSDKILLFYEIFDEEWIDWLQKVFWYLFRTAIPAEKRINDLSTIHNIYRYY